MTAGRSRKLDANERGILRTQLVAHGLQSDEEAAIDGEGGEVMLMAISAVKGILRVRVVDGDPVGSRLQSWEEFVSSFER